MGVEAAVVDGVSDADVPVQRDGAQVHDGCRREQDVQVDPDGTEVRGQRPAVVCWTRREDERLVTSDTASLSCVTIKQNLCGEETTEPTELKQHSV